MGILDSLLGPSNVSDSGFNQASAVFNGINLPSIPEMQIQLQQLVEQGVMTPEAAQAALLERSAMEDVVTDPAMKQAQLDALSQLQTQVDGGGLDAQSKARIAQTTSEINNAQRGQREAILAEARARGQGGSGMELASQLMNNQASSSRASQEALAIAAEAEKRKAEALQQLMAGQTSLRGQDFDEQAAKAKAKDVINQFNAQNQQQVNLTNTASRNNAQQLNLQNKQDVANKNVGISQQQEMYNKGLQQVDFDNKIKKASGQAGVLQNQATNNQNVANAQSQATNNLIGSGIMAGAMMYSDENLKTDVQEFDAAEFLDSITGFKYKYKDPKHGQGKQVGVMAQDLEKSVPQIVNESDEGKTIDYNKAGGPIFASLADIHERLKKIEGK